MNSNAFILERLQWPDHPVDVVLDTDTYNEVDDQFALAYLVASEQKLHIRGIFAGDGATQTDCGVWALDPDKQEYSLLLTR